MNWQSIRKNPSAAIFIVASAIYSAIPFVIVFQQIGRHVDAYTVGAEVATIMLLFSFVPYVLGWIACRMYNELTR